MDKKFVVKNTSRAEELLEKRTSTPPAISPKMAKGVSDYRKDELQTQVDQGLFSDGGSGRSRSLSSMSDEPTQASVVKGSSDGILKLAQGSSGVGPGGAVGKGGIGFRGSSGDTVRQGPEVYSPLWLNSNLNLPRDRATLNAWARSFFALNPIVQNAISLHSTYPISKLNVKCKNREVEQFFQDMVEEMDLLNKSIQIAQEFWVVGEAFVYAELDERQGKWSRLIIQNPDYIVVKQSVIAGEPIISLRPDENLRRVVFSNNPVDLQQRKQLDPTIIDHVKRGENIPLNNFYISHLARKISPYEVRGTSIIVSCFRDLMLLDLLRESKFAQAYNMINPLTLVKIGNQEFKPNPTDLEAWREIFECHDEETEVLTDQGFMKFDEVIEYEEAMDGTTGMSQITWKRPKPGIKIACFNPDTEELEYHFPDAAHIYDYDGEMFCFKSKKMDIKVTPDHKMWFKKNSLRDTKWEFKKAKDITKQGKFRAVAKWKGKEGPKTVTLCGKDIPLDTYLKFLGYVISEGHIAEPIQGVRYKTSLSQTITLKTGEDNPFFPEMQNCIKTIAQLCDLNYREELKREESSVLQTIWYGYINSKELTHFLAEEIGSSQGTKAPFKRIPRWVLGLPPDKLQIIIDALNKGDGHNCPRPLQDVSNSWLYTTSSQGLAADIMELLFKCGYAPTQSIRPKPKNGNFPSYRIFWGEGESKMGHFPTVRKEKTSRTHYKGKVWCFSSPTGLFVTRRNGKITIQSNSAQFDKDFKIFTHDAVNVERVGYAQGIYDTSADITQLIKEIYIGLMVPNVIMDGSDTTYATGSVALDVLRQRYLSFREMMGLWLRRKIFAPISKLQNFYEYRDGKKQLIIPEVDWNHMSLFDMNDYISNLINLLGQEPAQRKVSLHTVYRSMGLNYEDEIRKLRQEGVSEAIRQKETEALGNYTLNELRALAPGDEVDDRQEGAVPGEKPPEGGGDAGGPGESGGGFPPMPST